MILSLQQRGDLQRLICLVNKEEQFVHFSPGEKVGVLLRWSSAKPGVKTRVDACVGVRLGL